MSEVVERARRCMKAIQDPPLNSPWDYGVATLVSEFKAAVRQERDRCSKIVERIQDVGEAEALRMIREG